MRRCRGSINNRRDCRDGDLANGNQTMSAASVYVFDAYGTLFDVHAALALPRAGHYADFWTLTERALDYAFDRVPTVSRALRSKLLDSYLTLDAFADARAALTELKARGRRIAIPSNGTPHMLEAAVQASGIAPLCDAVLSVDVVRMYKPRPEVYALVTDRFGVEPGEVVFVSSNRWDIMGASTFGFRPVWVNRSRMPQEYPDEQPLRIVSDLSALASVTF